MNNPFRYGKEVTGEQFYDRTESAEELHQLLKDGVANVVLYAPRRYGKTSLVVKVLQRFQTENVSCVHFDVSKVSSVEKFCEAYASAIYGLQGGFREMTHKVLDYLAHLHPTVSGTVMGRKSIRFDYGARMNAMDLSTVLDLPEKLSSASGGKPIVIAFDEFQDVAELSKDIPLESVFRSCIQAHRNVRYVFLGSKTHLMKRMFGARTSPFYRAAQNMRIGKPPRAESEAFVVSRFAAEGVVVRPDALARIMDAACDIPYYVQAVSAYSFMSVERRKANEVLAEDVDAAIGRLLDAESDYYEEILHGLSVAQRNVLEALAAEPSARFDEGYRRRHALANLSTVHSSLDELVERGLVEKDKTGCSLGDPIFVRYLTSTSAATVYS